MGPLRLPVRRAMGKSLLPACIAVVLLASIARSAEVVVAEVEGTANHVTVEQGGTATVVLELRATGFIRCITSASNPATASFERDITIDGAGGISVGSDLIVSQFWAVPNGSQCRVTWPGDPAPQRLELTVRAAHDAPLGDHTYWPRTILHTPLGTGERLEDRTRTMLTFTVVPGSDTAPPEVSCSGPNGSAGANGWYLSPVGHHCSASDLGSGLANPADASFTLGTDGEGTSFTAERVVADLAGNHAEAGPFGPYNVDLNDPAVHVAVPADGAAFLLGADVDPSFACADGASGVASCEGGAIDTSTVGWKTFTASSSDNAGRTTTVTRSYQVVYGFEWGRGPSGTQKAGSAIPLSWSLDGVSDPGSYAGVDSLPCAGGSPQPAATQGQGGPTSVPGTAGFHIVVKTDKAWSGTCRTLRVLLSDGTAHGVDVAFG